MTKEEIKQEINRQNKILKNYESELSSYKNALNHSTQLTNDLKKSKTALSSSYENLKKGFTINNKTIDNGKIMETINKITGLIDDLEKKIIAEMESNINSLNQKIATTENKINQLWEQYNSATE